MIEPATRCLVLGCGNTLRSDDGVGPWLCAWAEKRFAGEVGVRVIARQQWTPELALEIAAAESVIFIDCSLVSEPGIITTHTVAPAESDESRATHEISAPELMALAKVLYGRAPWPADLLTIGAASLEFGEEFSAPVKACLAEACEVLTEMVWMALSKEGGDRSDQRR